MVGKRKRTGLAVRAVESVRRANRVHHTRTARAATPGARLREFAETTHSLVRRLPPHLAAAAARDAIRALETINRKYEKEVTR